MKKCAWLLTLATLALFVCHGLALAQGGKSEAEKTSQGEKQTAVMPPEGMDHQMMPGCPMMGQGGPSPSGMTLDQAGPMAGCGMRMGGSGAAGGGMGCCGAAMGGCGMSGAHPGMACMMSEDMAGDLCQHGCAGCYLKCAAALNLTDKQIGDLKAICSAAKKTGIQKQAEIRIAQVELNDLLSEEVLDFAKAKAKITEISELKASVQIEHLNNIQKAQKVLTAEQVRQCRAMCKGMGTCGAMTGAAQEEHKHRD